MNQTEYKGFCDYCKKDRKAYVPTWGCGNCGHTIIGKKCINLKHGETPWDNMSKNDLLLRVLKLYKAAESARCCLRLSRIHDENSPYWSIGGSGGSALNELDQAMSDVLDLCDSDQEVLWKGFYRNALPLLFKNTEWEWSVCEKCKHWLGTGHNGKPTTECFCGNKELRPIKWSDFCDHKFEESDISSSEQIGHCSKIEIGDLIDQIKLRDNLIEMMDNKLADHSAHEIEESDIYKQWQKTRFKDG